MEVTAAAVTGGARGIGKACIESLLQNNCKVTFCDMNKVAADETLTEFSEKFGKDCIFFLQCDVSNMQQLEGFFVKAKNMMGGLDLIVNNAGITELSSCPDWPKMVHVNLKGTLKGMEMALKLMGKDRGGSGGVVVSTGSISGIEPTAIFAQYAATKAAVIQATRSFGEKFWESTGVKFICLAPGPTATNISDHWVFKMTEDEQDYLAQYVSCHNNQIPDSVGKALIEVLQRGSTGSVWIIDGGELKPFHGYQPINFSKL